MRFISFNSLQTGRHIQTIKESFERIDSLSFQFPSNGKAHSDARSLTRHKNALYCFNSLQTGRHIQTTPGRSLCDSNGGFNSLQTGRHIQTQCLVSEIFIKVSIPFKREGTFRHLTRGTGTLQFSQFQFPSNGKAHSDVAEFWMSKYTESFKFPSNGKAHSDPGPGNTPQKQRSFNSLQTGRHIQTLMLELGNRIERFRFNSLQTGRHIQTVDLELKTASVFPFQFPSNGKAHSDHPIQELSSLSESP